MWRDGKYLLLSSPPIITEIKAVLELPRIKTKYRLNDLDIQKLVNLIEMDAILVPGTTEVGDPILRKTHRITYSSHALLRAALMRLYPVTYIF